MSINLSPVVLLSGDADLIQLVHAAAAARARHVQAVADPALVPAAWRDARAVLVGADLAPAVAALELAPRGEVYLIATASNQADLVAWSMPLRAAVMTLPAAARDLAAVLAGDGQAFGPVIAVTGGPGGAGATTLAAGLALAAARRGRTALVDLDPASGGADLVFGAESLAGWRWDTLHQASGQVADFWDRLPATDGVALVTSARTDRRPPGAEAAGAVIEGLSRHGVTVVADLGRRDGPVQAEALRQASRLVVVTGQSVRAVAATAARLEALEGQRADLVVRRERGGAIGPADIADALGVPLFGTVPHAKALPELADRGIPPGRVAGRRWAKACRDLADRLTGQAATPRKGGRP